jgi:FdhD protein
MMERSTTSLTVERVDLKRQSVQADVVATEEPMEIRVEWPDGDVMAIKSVAVTMRTPGDDFELAVGFLRSEGIVRERDHVLDVSYCPDPDDVQQFNIVNVTLSATAGFDRGMLNRNFYATSSCGVCGKASLEALRLMGADPLPPDNLLLSSDVVRSLPDALRAAQPVFESTGGLHASGLFDADGLLITVREDVGRHNALDKVVGHHLMGDDLPLRDRVLVVSGRASWELMQKALTAGIPAVVAVGAPSSLAVELARDFGMTLIGFARSGGFNIYSGAGRIASGSEHHA